MTRISIDTSELRTLAADMRAVDGRLARHIVPVVSKGALNIKKQIQADFRASGNAGFRYVAGTVSYDLETSTDAISAEIGPDKPSGALANIAVFGSSRGGGTVPDPAKALEAEADGFAQHLAELAGALTW